MNIVYGIPLPGARRWALALEVLAERIAWLRASGGLLTPTAVVAAGGIAAAAGGFGGGDADRGGLADRAAR